MNKKLFGDELPPSDELLPADELPPSSDGGPGVPQAWL